MFKYRSTSIRAIGLLAAVSIFALVFPHLSFAAGSDLGSTFKGLANNFSTLFFNYIGEVLFVVLFFVALLVLPRNFTLAMIILGIAILLAVGPTLAKGIWNFFSNIGSGGNGFNTIHHATVYASLTAFPLVG